MGKFAIGRNVRVEVSKTEGAPKTVTEVTAAKPGVASSTAHALLAKSIGYFTDVVGMDQLEGQACRLAPVTTDGFTLEGLDTTNYGDFTSGKFVPITAWALLAPVTEYSLGEAAADALDTTVIFDDQKQNEAGQLNAQSISFPFRAELVPSEGMQIVEDAAKSGAYLVFKITFKTGEVRYFRGQPGLPSDGVATGAVGAGTFTATIKRWYMKGAA